MAIDESILLGVAEGASPPTLRFFAWAPPCLSLGYAQSLADVDGERLKARAWGLVRRPTGGKAILHTDELTYSVITPQTDPRVTGGIVESYRRLSQGLVRGVVLQHGTLPLTGDITRICDALAFADEAEREQAKERVRARAITLELALGAAVSWEGAANAMKHGFREALKIQFESGTLSEAEMERARELRERKYQVVE
jgi:lipoate-protein ligase A